MPFRAPNDRHISHLPLLRHDCEERVVRRALIARQQRRHVFPSACFCYVGQREGLSFCRPLPSVGVPEATYELGQLGFLLRPF